MSHKMGIIHVSTGDILRDAVKGGEPLGKQVKSFLDAGKLVPDGLMGDVIEDRLGKEDAGKGFILDGFPRTPDQVHILDRVLGSLGAELDGAFVLTAPEEEIVRRLTGRRICPGCNAVYHVGSKPPKAAGICDVCGSVLVQREDDTEQVIRERLKIYETRTRPVLDAYRERGILVEVDGTGEPESITGRLVAELKKLGGSDGL